MNIEYLKVSEITPYQNNPRHNEQSVDKVAASIREFGFKQPIVIDKDNVIVCGHTRLMAAKKLKMDSVPCIRADDLTEEQIKAYRLADNKVAEFADWDFELLDGELDLIEGIDMEQFGFDFHDDDPEEEEEDPFEDIENLEKHYGVPYQGNKSRIADIIISLLPEGKRLVDLFGGGGRSHIVRCYPGNGNPSCITI